MASPLRINLIAHQSPAFRRGECQFKDIPNQLGQVRLAKKSAADLVEEWIHQLALATVCVYSFAEESAQISGEGNFFKLLRELNKKFFGGGLEELSINNKLFSPSGMTETVARYALNGERIKGSSSWLNLICDPFRELVVRGGNKYWLATPSHTISKMKLIVDSVIENGLAQQNEIAFSDIWNTLKKPPIGLLKCPGSVFLLTLLLKDYTDKNFYIRDFNNNTSSLTDERLCNLIVNTVKELPQARDKFIVKQTPEHKEFCRIIAEIFKISNEKINSVEDAAKNIKVRLTQSHYPLWSLKYFVEETYFDDPHKEIYLLFLKLLEEFINPQAGRDVTKVADDIFFIYNKNIIVIEELKNIVREENFKTGMTGYIAQYKPELIKIVGRLNLLKGEYLSRLNEKLSADAASLWKIDDVNRQIDNLFDELRLIESINLILSTPQKKLPETYLALGDKLNKIRIPRAVVEELQPDLKNLFQTFATLRNNTEKIFEQAAEQINQSTQIFMDFFENQFEFFSEALTKYLDGAINSKLIEKLFNDAPTGIFFKTRDDFVLQMKSRLQKFRQDEKTNKFFATWREITGTNSPAEWSNKNEIPILCAFQDCLDEAQLYFPALNRKSPLANETALDTAIKFIHSDKISRLDDKKSCERDFLKYFCGENYSVVVTAEDLSGILRQCIGNDVYSWFAKKKIARYKLKTSRKRIIVKTFYLPSVKKFVN